MINLFNTQIDEIYIHRVGNKCRGEGMYLSEQPYTITDEIRPLLKEFFLKPFREKEEQYFKFQEDSELESIFRNEMEIPYYRGDRDIAKLMYETHIHPHIKSGELYVCRLSNIELDNEKVSGFGIFKSELKADFMQFEEGESKLDLIIRQGVNLNKLDKGAIVLANPKSKTGFRILYIDSNKYDSKYWCENFLNLEELEDAIYQTKNYLEFVRGFAKDVVRPAEDKQQEVLFTNKAFDYFASNDEFTESSFIHDAIENPELIPEFQNYKIEKGPKYKVEDLSSFEIDNQAVTEIRKKNKSLIELDTNIQIKMDFVNAESAQKFIEKGWDEEKQMYYYLLYFNRELK